MMGEWNDLPVFKRFHQNRMDEWHARMAQESRSRLWKAFGLLVLAAMHIWIVGHGGY